MASNNQKAIRILLQAIAWAFVIFILFILVYGLLLWRTYINYTAAHNPVMSAGETITPRVGGGRLVGVYDYSKAEDGNNSGGFAKLRVTNIVSNGTITEYMLFSYARHKNAERINILFKAGRRSGIETKKFDVNSKFNTVLRPLKVIVKGDVDTLLGGDFELFLEDLDFPEACVFLAYDDSFGPAYGIGYKSAKACRDPTSKASIIGEMNMRGIKLCTDLEIRIWARTEQIIRRPQDMNCFTVYRDDK